MQYLHGMRAFHSHMAFQDHIISINIFWFSRDIYYNCCKNHVFNICIILTLSSQYIFSLLLFVVHNRGYFTSNSIYHNINTRQKNDFHLPRVSLTMYQKGAFYSGIKVFNALSMTIKDISSNPKILKLL